MISTEISPDVGALVAALQGVSPGATISYAALSEVIGRDITAVRYLLHSAQRIAAREHGAVFSNNRGVGYTRLTTDQLSGVGSTARSRVRRAAHKASKVIRQGFDRANDIAPEVGRKLNAELSALALIEHVASDKSATPVPAHDTRAEPVAVTARRLFQPAA
jgi:hypothetical protein